MIRLWVVVLSVTTLSSAQVAWVSQARLKDATGYFTNVMQETVYELEKYEWCNLKMLDFSQNLNEQMYDWLISGTVNYTNGYVVSIQRIDLDETIDSVFTSRTVDNVTTHEVAVRGLINLRDVEIGFDVVVDLQDEEQNQHYTGSFTYLEVQFEISIVKNLYLNTISVTPRVVTLSNGGRQMVYMPANSLSEVLSRNFGNLVFSVWNGIEVWARDIIAPIVLEVANKTQFPEVCFKNC